MLTTPTPDAAEIRTNRNFNAILWAFGRPGIQAFLTPPRQPDAQIVDQQPVNEAPIIEALLDRECAVYTSDPMLIHMLEQTCVRLVDLNEADYVFLGRLSTTAPLRQCRVGSDLYPDKGSTVVIRTTSGAGEAVRLSGPGINGEIDIRFDGLPPGFWQEREKLIRYPMGFDILFLNGNRLIGLPRSTRAKIL